LIITFLQSLWVFLLQQQSSRAGNLGQTLKNMSSSDLSSSFEESSSSLYYLLESGSHAMSSDSSQQVSLLFQYTYQYDRINILQADLEVILRAYLIC